MSGDISGQGLHEACAEGDYLAISRLLDGGADPNYLDISGNTAAHTLLTFALFRCRSNMPRPPPQQRAQHAHNVPPLLAVPEADLLQVLSLLLAHQWDVTSANRAGDTALHLAVQFPPPLGAAVAALLRHKGADVSAVNRLGESVVYLAARKGNLRLAEELRTHHNALVAYPPEAEAYIIIVLRESSFMASHQPAQCEDLVERLADGSLWALLEVGGPDAGVFRVEAPYSEPFILDVLRALASAPSVARLLCIKSLAERMEEDRQLSATGSRTGCSFGFDANIANSMGETPLHIAAAIAGDATGPLVRYLAAKGGDISAPTVGGATPLHYALAVGNLGVATVLLTLGSSCSGSATIASCAAASKAAHSLTIFGTSPRRTTSPRTPPASGRGDCDADSLFVVTSSGGIVVERMHTPFTLVVNNMLLCLQVSSANGLAGEPNRSTASSPRTPSVVSSPRGLGRTGRAAPSLAEWAQILLLVVDSPDVDVRGCDAEGHTLLHRIAAMPKDSCWGTDLGRAIFACPTVASIVSAASEHGRVTPLHEAIRCKAPLSFVLRLIREGADVNAADARGFTPLLVALCGARHDSDFGSPMGGPADGGGAVLRAVVVALLAAGAVVNPPPVPARECSAHFPSTGWWARADTCPPVTPLVAAVMMPAGGGGGDGCSSSIVELLIDHGAAQFCAGALRAVLSACSPEHARAALDACALAESSYAA